MKKTESKNPNAKKAWKVLKIIGNIFLWIFVAFSVFVTILAFAAQGDRDGIPTIGGVSFFSVTTNSMEPNIMQGDLIINKKLTTEEEMQNLKEQTVITFLMDDINGDGNRDFNTHRIIEVRGSGADTVYITRGDNEEANIYSQTETVPYRDVVRVWNGTRIPGVGKFLSFLQTPNGFLIVIVIPLVLFFLFELIKFIRAAIAVKNEGKKQITAADEELIKQKAIEEYLRQQKEAEEATKNANGSSDPVPPAEEPKADEPAVEEPKSEEPKPENEHPFEQAAEQVSEVLNAAEEKAVPAVEEIGETVSEKAEAAEEAVTETVEKAEEAVTETVEKAEEAVTETVEKAEETVNETVENAEEAVNETVENVTEKAEETVKEAAEEIADESKPKDNA